MTNNPDRSLESRVATIEEAIVFMAQTQRMMAENITSLTKIQESLAAGQERQDRILDYLIRPDRDG